MYFIANKCFGGQIVNIVIEFKEQLIEENTGVCFIVG